MFLPPLTRLKGNWRLLRSTVVTPVPSIGPASRWVLSRWVQFLPCLGNLRVFTGSMICDQKQCQVMSLPTWTLALWVSGLKEQFVCVCVCVCVGVMKVDFPTLATHYILGTTWAKEKRVAALLKTSSPSHKAVAQGVLVGAPCTALSLCTPSQTPENLLLWLSFHLWICALRNPGPQGGRQKRWYRYQNLPYGPTNISPQGWVCAHKGLACFDWTNLWI